MNRAIKITDKDISGLKPNESFGSIKNGVLFIYKNELYVKVPDMIHLNNESCMVISEVFDYGGRRYYVSKSNGIIYNDGDSEFDINNPPKFEDRYKTGRLIVNLPTGNVTNYDIVLELIKDAKKYEDMGDIEIRNKIITTLIETLEKYKATKK